MQSNTHNSPTLEECVTTFLERYEKRTTRRAYKRDLIGTSTSKGLALLIGLGIRINQIRAFDLTRAFNNFKAQPGIESPHTINKWVKSVKVFFNWCVKIDLLEKSPAKAITSVPTPDDSVLERTMPPTDFDAYVDYFRSLSTLKPKYLRALLLALLTRDTSARTGGLAGLRWKDVDFNEQSIQTTEKGGRIHIRFFGDVTAQVMRQWQIQQKVKREFIEDDDTDTAFVFGRYGNQMTPPALGQYFRRRCKDAGVKPQGLQAVRHLTGVMLQDEGVPSHLAAEVMGHSVETYIKSYASTDPKRKKQAASKIFYKGEGARKRVFRIRKASGEDNP